MNIDPDSTKVVLHATVPEELARGLKAIAEAEDRSVSAELRRAVAEHLRRAAERKDDT